MAYKSPPFKVYRDGKYVASLKHAEDAAAVVAMGGGVVKFEHKTVVWDEGSEAFPAGDSYDSAAAIMYHRAGARSVPV